MGIIRTTATIQLASGSAEVQIMIVTEPSEYTFDANGRGTPCVLKVFTSPTSYVGDVELAVSDPEAALSSQGTCLHQVEDEDVQLAAANEGERAVGTTQLPISSGFSAVNYGGIGEDPTIVAALLGTNQIRTRGECSRVSGQVSYTASGRQWTIRGQMQPKVDIEATLTY